MTAAHLKIAIADDELDMREFLAKMLAHLGHDVLVIAADGRELVERCRETPVDLIVTDIRMPEMDGIEAVTELSGDVPRPTILISAYHEDELVRRALGDHVFAYLVKPVTRDQLQPAIKLAMERFREFEALRAEARDLRQTLDDRRTIERAKRFLMTRAGLPESKSFSRLQELSRAKGRPLAEIARSIVLAEEALAE